MANDLLPRPFKFAHELFALNSPWRHFIGMDSSGQHAVKPVADNELQCYAMFEALKKGSVLATARAIGKGQLTQKQLDKLAREVAQIDQGGHLQHATFNYDDFSFPIFQAQPLTSGTTTVNLETYEAQPGYPSPTLPPACPNKLCQVTVPLPSAEIRPSGPNDDGSDGALVLFDPTTSREYDFWQTTVKTSAGAEVRGGNIGVKITKAGSASFFDATDNGLGAQVAQAKAKSASRATGLPYLGGLLVPEDFERIDYSGGPKKLVITHALAFTLPHMRALNERFPSSKFPPDYVYPASDHERTAGTVNPYALRAGQRIRLKQQIVNVKGDPIVESKLSLVAQIFFNTLRNYGAYLVDGATAFGFAAEDYHTAPFDVDLAKRLFEGPFAVPPVADKSPWYNLLYELEEQLREMKFQFAVPDKGDQKLQWINFDVVENPRPPAG
jgi:hypothetical protein